MTKRMFIGLWCLLASCGVTSAAEFSELVERLPDGPNAILVIDSQKMLASPMAVAGGWKSQVRDGRAPINLPPGAEKVVVAARLDPTRGFTRSWEAGLASLTEPISMPLLAKAEGGHTDEINGMDAARVPANAYFLKITPQLMGMRYPADRQATFDWAQQQTESGTSQLSEYLTAAAGRVAGDPQVVLALDASHLADAYRLRPQLQQSQIVRKYTLNSEEVLKTLLSLQGVALEIAFTDKARGTLRVDFGTPVTFSKDAAKDFIMAALSQFYAEIPGLEDWKSSVTSQSISLTGELNPDALRRVFSMLELPATGGGLTGPDPASADGSEADPKVAASKAYFGSVTKLVDDLKKNSTDASRDSYWQDRYAQKIDDLPILNVDADLLDFGQKTAQTLRVMSVSRTTANIRAGTRSADELAGAGSYNGYDGYSGYGTRNLGFGSSTHAIKTQERASSNITKTNGFKLISDATAEIRRVLTERYQVEF